MTNFAISVMAVLAGKLEARRAGCSAGVRQESTLSPAS